MKNILLFLTVCSLVVVSFSGCEKKTAKTDYSKNEKGLAQKVKECKESKNLTDAQKEECDHAIETQKEVMKKKGFGENQKY